MKKIAIMLIVYGFMSLTVSFAEENFFQSASTKTEDAIETIGDNTVDVAQKTTKAVKVQSKKAAKSIKKHSKEMAEKTSDAVSDGAKSLGEATKTGAVKAQKATAKGVKKAAKKVERSAQCSIERANAKLNNICDCKKNEKCYGCPYGAVQPCIGICYADLAGRRRKV